MSNYAEKRQKRIDEERRDREALETEMNAPNTTPHKVTAYVRDIYRRVIDNGYVKQGITAPKTAAFEREHPWARGGNGTYVTHEYGGTQLIVELSVPEKEPFFVDVRSHVLELNQLVRIDDPKIAILKKNNERKKLVITVVDTISKWHGKLVDVNEVIAQLNLICR